MKVQARVSAGVLMLFACLAHVHAHGQENRLAEGEHYAEVNGMRLWYKVVGKGPLLVIQSPGWGIGSTYLQNGLAPLTKHFTMLFYDARGNGRSSRPSDPMMMSPSDLVGDLEELRKYWGLESMNLMGHSHGGRIALAYAVQFPDRVRRLIVVDTSVEGYDSGPAVKMQIEARAGDKRFSEAITEVNSPQKPTTDEEFAASLHRMIPLFFHDPASNVAKFEQTESGLPSLWARHAVDDAEDKKPMNVADKLDRIRAPTLILVGHDDWGTPVAASEYTHAGVKGSKLVVFPKTGHFPWIEDPQEFFKSVEDFAGK